MLDAGIVDENVDGPEALRGRGDKVLDLLRPGHVGAVIKNGSGARIVQRLADRLDFVRLAKAVDDDIGALGCKRFRDAEPDAAR